MGKKIKTAKNGLKMILANFQHVELSPPPGDSMCLHTHTQRLMVITISARPIGRAGPRAQKCIVCSPPNISKRPHMCDRKNLVMWLDSFVAQEEYNSKENASIVTLKPVTVWTFVSFHNHSSVSETNIFATHTLSWKSLHYLLSITHLSIL